MDANLKYWITRPEIERLFWISTPTFNSWAAKGKFGDPVGTVPNVSGRGRPKYMYSMRTVMDLYEVEYVSVATRAIAQGASLESFPEYKSFIEAGTLPLPPSEGEEIVKPVVIWMWCDPATDMWGLYSSELFDIDFDSDTEPYYDGLPKILNLDNIDKSLIPDKPDLWDEAVSLLCPPFAASNMVT